MEKLVGAKIFKNVCILGHPSAWQTHLAQHPPPTLLSDPLTKVRATTATAAPKIPPILHVHHCLLYRKIDLNKTPA